MLKYKIFIQPSPPPFHFCVLEIPPYAPPSLKKTLQGGGEFWVISTPLPSAEILCSPLHVGNSNGYWVLEKVGLNLVYKYLFRICIEANYLISLSNEVYLKRWWGAIANIIPHIYDLYVMYTYFILFFKS